MNDGMLSQEEIDALLQIGNDDADEEVSMFSDQVFDEPDNTDLQNRKIQVEDYLSELEIDTLGEVGNISFGSSATALSTILNQKVEITTPTVSVIKGEDVANEFNFDHVSIRVNYVEGFTGQNVLVMKSTDASIISDIMLGGDGTNAETTLTEIHISAVQEAMNQMMGSAATSMSTVFDKRVDISPPAVQVIDASDQNRDTVEEETTFIKILFRLKIGELIDSNIMQLIPMPFAKELAVQLISGSGSDEQSINEPVHREQMDMSTSTAIPQQQSSPNTGQVTNNEQQLIGRHAQQENAVVQQADFQAFEQTTLNNQEQRNLDMLLDIPLRVTVELGRTKQTIKDILELGSGSIIELDRLAGEPVDILVNDKRIAKGEVVVIDENFGVRLTNIVSQSARLENLK